MRSPYERAQVGVAMIKRAVLEVLDEAGDSGLTNAAVGRSLGIYAGYAESGHVGHVSRAMLGQLEHEGLVEQDTATKRWRLKAVT